MKPALQPYAIITPKGVKSMDSHSIETVSATIAYIETHLNEKLNLETAAKAAGYSKYHLHRTFAAAAGQTVHSYTRRRRLTEAAKQLVYTQKPILEIALAAGYESQQAFTTIFKSMYKQTPQAYRQNRTFYPLQLALTLNQNPTAPEAARKITYANQTDIPAWKDFITLVIDGFPCLDETEHLRQVKQYIQRRQALITRDGAAIIGAAAFSGQTGSIDFLAVHPQYRRYGIAKAFLAFLTRNPFAGREISVTTFRAGDKADTGQREAYRRLGFTEGELLTEFGYPTQRLTLPPKREKSGNAR